MMMEENVHGEVSDIFGDRQEVEDKCDVENGDDQPKIGSFCDVNSHVTEKEGVLLDNGNGKNDADGSFVFVSGSEAVAADVDPAESDLNVGDSYKKSNSGESVPCFSVDSNGNCAASEGIQDELSSGTSGENNYPPKHDKFDGQQFDIKLEVDELIAGQPLPESQGMLSEAAESECERQQILNAAKDCTDGSVVSARLFEETREIIINSAMSPEFDHHVDGENVGRESESASDKESQELEDVVVAVEEKELTESESVPDLRGSQELINLARADAQYNLAGKKNLSEYVDEIVIEGKPVSGLERLEEDSEQDLTTDSCLVADMKIGAVIISGTGSNENRDGSITGYHQDRISTTVDSNQTAGELNIPFEIIESDIGRADSNQDTSLQNGSIESVKTSPVPVSGENASIESNQCHPREDKIEGSKSSPACTETECGKLGTKRCEITDSFLFYDTEPKIEPDNGLLLDKPTFPSDDATTNAHSSSINNNASGGNFDNDAATDVESHANSLTENGSNLHNCSVKDVKLVPETQNLSALSSTDTSGDGNVIPNMNGDAVDSEGAPSVDISVEKEEDQYLSFDGHGTREVRVSSDTHGVEDSRPTREGSTVVLDGQNMGAEVGKKPFYFLIRLPRYDDDGNMKEQIKQAQFQVDDKTKKRDAIQAEVQIQKATCKECSLDVEAAISAERSARDLLKSRRQEIDSIQSIINRLNDAISVEDIDGRIRNMEHMIEHETLPLKEEKHLLRLIKQLKQHREELSSNMGKQDLLQQSVDHKDSIEEHFKRLQLLRKELESLRQNVMKVEAVTKAAKKKYHDNYSKLSELLAQFKAADDIRQEAYAKLQTLRKQLYEKNKNFWDYKSAVNKANELAAEGKKEELQCFCVNQVESIMQLWNKDDEFRREYVRCNTRNTLRRLRTLDGRSLGPDEEPPVISNVGNERASKINSLSLQSTLEQETKAGSAETVNLEVKPVSKVLVQRSLPTKTKKPPKPALLEKSLVVVSSWDEVQDVREEPMRTKEEEELISKAEEVRKEEEAAKLKEKRRLEEMAKAKEALLRKKRNADKAQQRAALRAQKEAEQKEKEREKRVRKKERRKAVFNHDMQEYVRVSTAPVCVNYNVATDRKMKHVVTSGQAYTSSDIDWTVKVEATGLKPFTQYYYQFTVCDSNNASPVGRTKTAPAPDDNVSELSVAVYSCSNYPFGYFNAFGNSVRKDSVDYVLHLGDFIYEYAEGAYGWGWAIDRISQPDKEIRTLYDYRKRHASYRADFDSILSFASYAWIPVWDDHEVGDNTYRDGMADHNNTEDSFVQDGLQYGGAGLTFDQRKMNAVRAYFEWMPIRQVEMDDNLRIWRSFSLGNLADIVMLDTRQYDRSVTDLYWNSDYIHEIQNDAGRSLMGSRQENWFYNQLTKSKKRGAAWRLIGSQIVFSRLNQSTTGGADDPYNMDAWDGYQANRNRTFQHLYNNNITNNILMAGDSHMSWVSDLVWLDEHDYDPKTGAGSVGVEFSGSAVSSPCPHGQNITLDKANKNSAALVAGNRELLWQDMYYRGYYELTLSHEAVHAKYYGIPTLVHRTPLEVSLANFTVLRDANAVKRPIAGGVVESGAVKFGEMMQTNLTYNTATGEYAVHNLSTFGYDQTID